MHTLSIQAMREALQKRLFSSVELTQHFLNRIHHNSNLNAFITTYADEALKLAANADYVLKNGCAKLLTGIPMAHKDVFYTRNLLTTCASKLFANFYPSYNATLVSNLQDQGAILLGKTNMDELSMGSTTSSSAFGLTKNPWQHDCVPGGSSGGSAASVAARLVPFATGSDTGGSIRQPASFCGISGLKPSHGRISRYGMMPLAPSLDQPGPMANSVADLALILNAMTGIDGKDSSTMHQPTCDFVHSLQSPLRSFKFAAPSFLEVAGIEEPIQQAFNQAIKILVAMGGTQIALNLQTFSDWLSCYHTICSAEAFMALSDKLTPENFSQVGSEVQRRFTYGKSLVNGDLGERNLYNLARKQRQTITHEFTQAFESIDIIITPTTAQTAFSFKNYQTNPSISDTSDALTVVANLTGLPALSIPMGFHQGMPMGLQLTGPMWSEDLLLRIGHAFQMQTQSS